jgi:hypothetical protein
MSNETISKIKLRLNNNIRSKQSKDTRLMALNNRMSATDYSACNDFFANCCDCCTPGCSCCLCLSGFFIIVSGWENGGDCDCEGLNGGPVWAPWHIVDDMNPFTSCHKGGQVPGFGSFGVYTCPPSDIERTALHWGLTCMNGKLILTVVTNSRLVRNLRGGLSHGIVASVSVEVENCDSLAIDETVGCEVGSGSPDCICPGGIRIQTFPVFGVQLPSPYPQLPEECMCCPTRCGVLDPDCLNPISPVLNATITDNCGTRTFTIISENADPSLPNSTWRGTTTLSCCDSENIIKIELTCINGGYSVDISLFIPGEGFEVIFSCDTDWECDPFVAIAKPMPKCTTFGTISPDCQPYCITSLIMQE